MSHEKKKKGGRLKAQPEQSNHVENMSTFEPKQNISYNQNYPSILSFSSSTPQNYINPSFTSTIECKIDEYHQNMQLNQDNPILNLRAQIPQFIDESPSPKSSIKSSSAPSPFMTTYSNINNQSPFFLNTSALTPRSPVNDRNTENAYMSPFFEYASSLLHTMSPYKRPVIRDSMHFPLNVSSIDQHIPSKQGIANFYLNFIF